MEDIISKIPTCATYVGHFQQINQEGSDQLVSLILMKVSTGISNVMDRKYLSTTIGFPVAIPKDLIFSRDMVTEIVVKILSEKGWETSVEFTSEVVTVSIEVPTPSEK